MDIKKLFAVFTAASALFLSACGQSAQNGTPAAPAADTASAQEAVVYRVGANAVFAPFEYTEENGNIAGFDVDLLNAMGEAGGFKVTFRQVAWDAIFASLESGESDILASAITITPERAQSMDFTEPYFEIRQVVLVHADSPVQSADELKNLSRIGVVTGQTGDLAMQKMLGATSSQIVRYETLPLVINDLQNGGVNAVVSDSAAVEAYAKSNGAEQFRILETDGFPKEEYGIAVRKGDTATLAVLNAALKTLRENGGYERIYAKYFSR